MLDGKRVLITAHGNSLRALVTAPLEKANLTVKDVDKYSADQAEAKMLSYLCQRPDRYYQAIRTRASDCFRRGRRAE